MMEFEAQNKDRAHLAMEAAAQTDEHRTHEWSLKRLRNGTYTLKRGKRRK